jgi:hypothetical protein
MIRAILIICLFVMALSAFKVILPREQSQNTLTPADMQAKPTVLPLPQRRRRRAGREQGCLHLQSQLNVEKQQCL